MVLEPLRDMGIKKGDKSKSWSELWNPFPRISNSFPWFTPLVLSDCNYKLDLYNSFLWIAIRSLDLHISFSRVAIRSIDINNLTRENELCKSRERFAIREMDSQFEGTGLQNSL